MREGGGRMRRFGETQKIKTRNNTRVACRTMTLTLPGRLWSSPSSGVRVHGSAGPEFGVSHHFPTRFRVLYSKLGFTLGFTHCSGFGPSFVH
jgi:hypothetical protein